MVKKFVNKKYFKYFLFFFIFILWSFPVYASWWNDDKSTLDFLKKYQDYFRFSGGNFFDVNLQSFSWVVIKIFYWVCNTFESLIPQSLSLFDFVNSSTVNKVYQSVLNNIVVGVMILSLILIGYKMIFDKGNLKIKSIAMNVVISVVLILLIPTVMTSGIEFAKTFYKDSTSIAGVSQGVAWNLVKNNITDLVYINKKDMYDSLGKNGVVKNSLLKDSFLNTDFTEVITPDTVDKLENDNSKIKYLKYRLTADGEGNFQIVDIKSGFMSVISAKLKCGYYRFTKDTFSLLLGLSALGSVYLFSAFIIISSIIELAVKRVLSVVVFASDLETGKRSKLVLSDILRCYFIIGFQGFSLSMFAMFVNFIDGKSINIFIKVIALWVSALVLMKGNKTISRYFGVDAGVNKGRAIVNKLNSIISRKVNFDNDDNEKSVSNVPAEKKKDVQKQEKNFGDLLSEKSSDKNNVRKEG